MKCTLESCNNTFENKTGRKKFCSNACKMKWYRKNPKKEEVTKFDLKVVYNELLDLAQKLSVGISTQSYNQPNQNVHPITKSTSDFNQSEDQFKGYQYYENKVNEVDFDDAEKLIIEIMASRDIKEWQKNMLKKMINEKFDF